MNEKTYFTNPDIYAKSEVAPENIKKGFLTRILPFKYIKSTLYLLLLSFISPIVLVMMNAEVLKDEKVFYPVFWTLCISFVIYAILAGAVLIVYKIPYMQELKEKLGYTQRQM